MKTKNKLMMLVMMLLLFSSSCSIDEAEEPVFQQLLEFASSNENQYCPNGGIIITEGLDLNNDGILNAGEIESTSYICHGTNGQDGEDGEDGYNSLISFTEFEQSEYCEEAGIRIDAGLDIDRDGILDADEILATTYLCDGQDGIDGEDGEDGDDGIDGISVGIRIELAKEKCPPYGDGIIVIVWQYVTETGVMIEGTEVEYIICF